MNIDAYLMIEAVNVLHPTGRYLLRIREVPSFGEAEYNAAYSEVIGETDQGIAIENFDPANFLVTYSQAKTKYDELLAAQEAA